MRPLPGGQILCADCLMAWQGLQPPIAGLQSHAPNPAAAAVLGLIPGVGAMYNGQFIKGLLHVVVFAVLIGLTGHYPLCGIFIGAWVIYQSFEAYHTARAMRDGEPLPDPLGLNEVGNWLNPGGAGRSRTAGQTGIEPTTANSSSAGQGSGGGYQPPMAADQFQASAHAPYEWTPYRSPSADFVDPADPYKADPYNQSVPPLPPIHWRRKEPIGAIVLIALGLLFLLGQLDIFSGRLLGYAWPVALIALGVWLIVRRIGDSRGGLK
jgi:TM2 domain-containing membrane protein YozV